MYVSAPMKKHSPYTFAVPALDKGLDILEALSQAPGPLTIIDLASQLNSTRNGIFPMLDNLPLRELRVSSVGDTPSERELCPHLKLSGCACSTRNLTKGSIAKSSIRDVECGMVEDVESLPSQLQLVSLTKRKLSKERRIQIPESGRTQRVSSSRTECIDWRSRECRGIEELLRRTMYVIRIAD